MTKERPMSPEEMETKERPMTAEETAIAAALHRLYEAKNYRGIVAICGRVVSVRLAAHIFGVTKRHLNAEYVGKALPAVRIGNEAVVRLSDLFSLIRRPVGRQPRKRKVQA